MKKKPHTGFSVRPFINPGGSFVKFAYVHKNDKLNRTQEVLRKKTNALNKRVKELNCIYGFSILIDKKGMTLADIFQETVELVSQSAQYPEITCARVGLEGKEFKTANYKDTIWKLTSDIMVHGKHYGVIEVCNLEEIPENDNGPFLKEERTLINAVAERLGKICERKQAEETVLKNEVQLLDLIENSPTGVTIIRKNKAVYMNSTQKLMACALFDSSLYITFENIHPDDLELVEGNYQKLAAGEKQHINMEFRFYPAGKMADGLDMKWVYCMARVIDYKEKEAILLNLMDITISKELDHILRIQDKMTSLGRVAAGIAHEIRNPLSGINIYLNALGKIAVHYDNYEKVTTILAQLQSASNKIESVIKRVLDFSRPSEPKFGLIDINQPIKEAVDLSSVTLRKSGIHFSTTLSDDLPKCNADPHMIEQVLLNLIGNASDALHNFEKSKTINISSSLENGTISIRVSDSGPGIPKGIRNNVFEPFYSTKSSGSGIGLSICHRIISDHGWSLHISSADLGGAEFLIRIPIVEKTGKK